MTRSSSDFTHLDEERTSALVDEQLALDAAEAAFRDSVAVEAPASLVLRGPDPVNRFSVKPAVSPAQAAVKIGSYWPGNDELGLPRHHSTVLLLDRRTGRIGALLEVATANAYRTAAADALAVRHLARADASVHAVFGTGRQAEFEVRAVARVRSIERVLVVGRSAERAAALVTRLRGTGVDARAADPRQACTEADVISTVTTATAPLLDDAWIRPGTHVSAMGADGPGKQELPTALLARASLFCDLPDQARRMGEFQHAPAGSPLTPLGDVLVGTAPGRRSAEEITVFDSSGIGMQDLHLGLALLEAAS